MAEDIVGSAKIRIELDESGVVPEARRLGRRIERALEDSTRGAGRGFRRDGEQAAEEFVRGADGRLRDARGRFARQGRQLGGDLVGGLGGSASLLGDALAVAARGLTGLVAGAGALSLLSIGLASATTTAIGLTAALAPAAGLIAALPAGALLLAGAMGTLRLALLGVSDAFEAALSGDQAEFEKSLKELAPAARSVARELRAAKPAIDDLRASVQGAFFAPLQGEITALVVALRGPLTRGMSGVASQLGRLAVDVSRFARSAAGVRLLDDVFATLRNTLAGIRSQTVDRLLTSLALFVRGTLPAFDGLGAAIDQALNRFSAFLARATAAGDGLAWIEGAKTALLDLAGLLADVGAITAGVFRAANASGAGLAGTLGTLLDGVRAFVESARGQTALIQTFDTLQSIGSELGPIIAAVVVQLGGLGSTIAELAQISGPALVSAINAIGSGLRQLGPGVVDVFDGLSQGIDRIASSGVLAGLARELSGVLTAVAPLGPAVGDLVVRLEPVGVLLADLLEALAPLAPAAAVLLGSLADGLGLLAGALTPVVGLIDIAVSAFTSLPGPLQAAAVALGLVVALRGPIAAFGTTMANLPGKVTGAATSIATGLSGLRLSLSGVLGLLGGPWGLAITAGVTAISLFGQKQAEARARVEGLTGTLDEQTGSITSNTRQWLANQLAESGAIDQARQLGIAVSDLVPYLEGNAEAQARVNAKLEEYGGTAPIIAYLWDSNLRAADDLNGSLESLSGVLGDAKKQHEDTAAAAGQMAQGERETAGAVSAATTALRAQSDELRAQIDPVFAFMRAQEDLRLAQDNYNRAVKENKANSREAAAAAAELTSKGLALGAAASMVGGQFSGGLTPALRGTLSAAGLTDKQIQGVERALKRATKAAEEYEGDYRAQVHVDGAAQALQQLRSIRAEANRVSQARGGVPLGGGRPLAAGAVIDRPTFALVGEAGREVVIPLTRPQRARQLARESGLLDVLAQGAAAAGGGRHAVPAPAGVPGQGGSGSDRRSSEGGDTYHTWHIHGATDPEATARRVFRRIELATAGGF